MLGAEDEICKTGGCRVVLEQWDDHELMFDIIRGLQSRKTKYGNKKMLNMQK